MLVHVSRRLPEGGRLSVVRSLKPRRVRGRAYTRKQIRLVAARQNPRNALATEIAHAAGLRAHELLTLARPDGQPPDRRPARHEKFAGRPWRDYTVVGKGGLVRIVRLPDRLAERLEAHRRDDLHRRDAIADILLDYARELRHRVDGDGDTANAIQQLRNDLHSIRNERHEVVKALAVEREAVASLRGKLAAARRSLGNALATAARLRDSRAKYRDLVVRVEAALLGDRPREDLGGLERRLEQALRSAGFEMPRIPHREPALGGKPPPRTRRSTL